MRSGVRPGRQTEREERDSGVATVGVGSVARCALGGDRYTGTHQHKCHAHILDTANIHPVFWHTGAFMLAYISHLLCL